MPSTSNTIWRREWRSSRRLPGVLVFVLLALGAVRIVATYHVLSQAADEPATIAAGMEWLDKGTTIWILCIRRLREWLPRLGRFWRDAGCPKDR